MKRVFKLLISLAVYWADHLHNTIGSLFGWPPRGRCVVLYYHEVTESERKRFAAQLDIICREARPVSALSPRQIEPGGKYFALTVDDAFISFFKNGLPELEQRQIPVLVFVPTGWLGRRVDWAMEEVMASPNERISTLAELKAFVQHPLVRFASHTANHRKLSALSDVESWQELSESKAFLERELGSPIEAVSFPYGGFTTRDIQTAAKLGYKVFFTTTPATVQQLGAGTIGRFRLDPSDWMLEARLKAAAAYRWQSALQRLRLRQRGVMVGAEANISAASSV